MNMVNASWEHWRKLAPPATAGGEDRRWYPKVAVGMSLRRLHPELEQTTGNMIVQADPVCPFGPEGVSAADLDAAMPLSASSPIMATVVRAIASERRTGSLSRARRDIASGNPLPGFTMYDAFNFEEARRRLVDGAPLLILNDMTGFGASEFDFGRGRGGGAADKTPGRIFFSTDGLAGKMGVDGGFENGFLSLPENTRLFRTHEYKHVWTAQFACSSAGAAATLTHVGLPQADPAGE